MTSATIPSEFDVGCTIVKPVRITTLAAVCSSSFEGSCSGRFDDKRFPGYTVNLTVRGSWEFHGHSGRSEVHAGNVILGDAFDEYGCRHDVRTPNKNLLVGLSPIALDPDEPRLFGSQFVTLPSLEGRVRLAMRTENLDHFDSLVFELIDEIAESSQGSSRRKSTSRIRMQRAKRFIEAHVREPIGLKEIADSVGLSSFFVLRQFRHAFGLTPHSYLLGRRLAEAMRLLKASRDEIAQVARDAGFRDPAYFSRFFTRSTGLTPTAFRAQENPKATPAPARTRPQ